MQRVLLMCLLLLAASTATRADIAMPPDAVTKQCDDCYFRLGVEIKPVSQDAYNGDVLIIVKREVMPKTPALLMSSSDLELVIEDVTGEPAPHNPFSIDLNDTSGVLDHWSTASAPGVACEVYWWSIDVFIWHTTKVHNGSGWKVTARAKGRYCRPVYWPNYRETDEAVVVKNELEVSNLVLTTPQSPEILVWDGVTAPEITLQVSDSDPRDCTVTIRIYAVHDHSEPVKTIVEDIETYGTPPQYETDYDIVWDGLTDAEKQAPRGLYVYTVEVAHDEDWWSCVQPPNPAEWPYWSPCDASQPQRDQTEQGSEDLDTRNGDLTIHSVSVAQVGEPENGYVDYRVIYYLSAAASACKLCIFDSDLQQVGQPLTLNGVSAGSHDVDVNDLEIDPEELHYFVVCAWEDSQDNKGHTHKPALELGAATRSKPVAYQYDNNGSLESVTFANGTSCAYAYDERYRLRQIKNKETDGGTMAGATFNYTVDGASNRTQIWADEDYDDDLTEYGYDAINRLISATPPTGPVRSYVYDWVGNRAMTGYAYDAADRLNTSTPSFTYYGTGSLHSGGVPSRTYTYDQRELLSTVDD